MNQRAQLMSVRVLQEIRRHLREKEMKEERISYQKGGGQIAK
jgi:hypothetical protein